jgi:hypothetical protein
MLSQVKIDELKQVNKEYLMTTTGRKDLMTAVELQREWNKTKSDIQVTTSGVKLNKFSKDFSSNITKVPIIPIGLNNFCYSNSSLFTKCGFKSCIGFNITACACGKKISFELHSLNEKDGTLYDFTKDFNKETEKYFLRVNTNLPPIVIRDNYTQDKSGFLSMNKGCRCNVGWTRHTSDISQEKFEDLIKRLEHTHYSWR